MGEPAEILRDSFKTTRKFDSVIAKELRAAVRGIDAAIANAEKLVTRGSSQSIRVAQMRMVKAEMLETLSKFWDSTERIIKTAKKVSAERAAALSVLNGIIEENPELGINERTWISAMKATAKNNLDAWKKRVEGDSYRELSKSVYNNRALSNGTIDRLVNGSLASGQSAREMAKTVRDLINPNVRGGISYAAMRLSRTEINNAYHASTIGLHSSSPFVSGFEWHLSGSHPKPDICNELVGEYPVNEVPSKPHPQCYCYIAPITISNADMIKGFKAGDYNEYLDDILAES